MKDLYVVSAYCCSRVCVCVCELVAQLYLTLCDPMDYSPPGSSVCGILQARILKNTGVHSHFLLQGIFPAQGLNPGLSHYRQIIYHLRHQESPEWSLLVILESHSLVGKAHMSIGSYWTCDCKSKVSLNNHTVNQAGWLMSHKLYDRDQSGSG